MPLSPEHKEEVHQILSTYCENRVPPKVRDQVRVGFDIRGASITLYEERPYFRDPKRIVKSVVAQLRFDQKTSHWTLYCADRNSRWHKYIGLRSSKSISNLLREIDRDPTGIFWG